MTDRALVVLPNYEKQARYARAHERLKLALKYGFHIEAAMICESIITDRLHSHLHWRIYIANNLTPEMIKPLELKHNQKLRFLGHPNFGFLIKVIQSDFDHLGDTRYIDLPARLDDWRKSRNRIAHGTVYTEPGKKTYVDTFEAFLERARICASDGKPLLDCLNSWDRAIKSKHRKAVKLSDD